MIGLPKIHFDTGLPRLTGMLRVPQGKSKLGNLSRLYLQRNNALHGARPNRTKGDNSLSTLPPDAAFTTQDGGYQPLCIFWLALLV